MHRGIFSVLFVLSLTAFATVTFFTFRHVALNINRNSQRLQISADTDTIRTAFSSRVETISRLNKDWAQWDDTYKFIQDLNKEYIESNLVDETLQTTNLNMMLFFDKNGYIAYKKVGSLGGYGDTTIPAEVLNYTTNSDNIDVKAIIKTGKHQDGFLATTHGTFVFSIDPILDSQGQGPALGALLLARYINSADAVELRNSTGHAIDFVDPSELGGKFHSDVSLADLQKNELVIQETPTNFSTYFLINDTWGNPAVVINVQKPILGIPNTLKLASILTSFSVLFSALFALLMIKTGNVQLQVY